MAPEPVPSLAMRAAFASWFGLEAATTRVLLTLYQAHMALPVFDLAVSAEVTPHSLVRHHMPRLRQTLDNEAVDRSAGGYWLTEAGRQECLAVLWRIGEELRRAS